MTKAVTQLKQVYVESCCEQCGPGVSCSCGDIGPSYAPKALLHALCSLRLAYVAHQNAHWEAKGVAFAADHQLFQRLYESAAADVDALAEKIAGLFTSDMLALAPQLEECLSCPDCSSVMGETEASVAAAMAEEHALAAIEEAYDAAEDEGALTLGLDDLLMSLANNRETSLYLLQQRGLS